ncbi:MAG: ABC transporter ATP-binding protein [Myxococcota bacterium]
MIRVERVRKIYREGKVPVEALRGVSVEIARGQFVSIMGPSGSGKSTLLNLIGALDRPSEGDVSLESRAYSSLDDDQLSLLRRRRIGFVFQFFNLMPTLTALENVLLPALLDGRPSRETEERAVKLLEHVGLAGRASHRPAELSGGEMQRVAIARALVTRPPVVLADEPTGNLDRQTGREVLALLRLEARESGTTVVMVTHDPEAAAVADRTITLRDGKIVEAG